MLKDTRPDDPEELIEPEQPKGKIFICGIDGFHRELTLYGFGPLVLGVGEEEEPAPPKPFEFTR